MIFSLVFSRVSGALRTNEYRLDSPSSSYLRKSLAPHSNIYSRHLLAAHANAEHEDVLKEVDSELEREDAEIDALIKRANSVVSGHGNRAQKPKSNTLADTDVKYAHDLGLTDRDIDDIRKIKANPNADIDMFDDGEPSTGNERALGNLPPHMVAPHKKLRGEEVKSIVEQSRKIVSSMKGKSASRNIELPQPGAPREFDDVETNRERAELRSQVKELTKHLDALQEDKTRLRSMLSKAQQAFQHSLQEARQESKDEIDEMRTTIEEQKRAFDELFEEKQIIAKVLSDEQKTLKELQERIQHPDLAMWLGQRAKRAALLIETPESDAMKFYAKKYMAPRVEKMRHRLELLESRVERTVDHLLPAKYGSFVALLLSIALIAFPVFVTMSTVLSLTTRMSLKQYVLLGNVFLTAFALTLCFAGLILQQDPLQTLYEASSNLFILIQLLAAFLFPLFLLTIVGTVLRSQDRLDMFVFSCEFVFYLLVGMNYRVRIWRPVMLGQNIETGPMMYFVYLMDFISMTMLTVSAARVPDQPSFVWDVESGARTGKPKKSVMAAITRDEHPNKNN